jgi:hypothetical protein
VLVGREVGMVHEVHEDYVGVRVRKAREVREDCVEERAQESLVSLVSLE